MKKRVIAYLHTHWDREWYREFEVFRLRLLRVFDNVLDMLTDGKIPSFYFDGQVSAMLDEALMKGGTPENGNTLNAEIGAIISDYSHRVGYGVLTPEEAGYQLYDDLNHILEQQKK